MCDRHELARALSVWWTCFCWWCGEATPGDRRVSHDINEGRQQRMEWILGAFGGPNYHHLTLGCTSSQYRCSRCRTQSLVSRHRWVRMQVKRWHSTTSLGRSSLNPVMWHTIRQTVLFTTRRSSDLYNFHLTWQYISNSTGWVSHPLSW